MKHVSSAVPDAIQIFNGILAIIRTTSKSLNAISLLFSHIWIDTQHTLTQTQLLRRKYKFGGGGGGGDALIEILSFKNHHFPFEFLNMCEAEDKKSIPLADTR